MTGRYRGWWLGQAARVATIEDRRRRVAALPTGTATLLFTDIESSTRLLAKLGYRYATVLHQHRELLLAAFARHGGVPVGCEGDSLFVAFEKPSLAIAAAIDGQKALGKAKWEEACSVRVRMGIHTGEVDVVDDDYVGMAVHVAARVCAAAHGGQVLATETTCHVGGDRNATCLGWHELKDVGEFRLFQLTAEGLAHAFPPPKSLASRPDGAPSPARPDRLTRCSRDPRRGQQRAVRMPALSPRITSAAADA
jgi:class 3 adenylate cyclase